MKWHGVIGFADTVETEPGIWIDDIFEHTYYGDIIRNTRSLQPSGGVNDNINVSNSISIIADPYAVAHFSQIKCVELVGTRWTVTSVEVQSPRLILTLGGVYNGS